MIINGITINESLFNSDQLEQIHFGITNKTNVSIYADPKFSDRQMEQIRLGLIDGCDISVYVNPKGV